METYKEFIKRKNTQFKSNKSLIPMKDIGRKGRFYFIREAWTFMPQCNLNKKIFIIERLKKEKIVGNIAHKNSNRIGDVEYRVGYYIVGKNGRARDKWVWGQFCPLIPVEDFNKLISKAKKEGTIFA